MVVYLNKGREAQRFIQEEFFTAGGESGYTKAFERRERPKQCYNCQEITDQSIPMQEDPGVREVCQRGPSIQRMR